jgi:hypothetical protein
MVRGGHEVFVNSCLLTDKDPCFIEFLQHVPHVLDFFHVFAQDGPAKHIFQFPNGGIEMQRR